MAAQENDLGTQLSGRGTAGETIALTGCDLCGLDCGRHPLARCFDDAEKVFCCLGCMNVYAILLESGVIASGQDIRDTELFKRSLELGLISNRNGEGAQKKWRAAPEILPDAPARESLFQVAGMWCSSCAWLIEHVVARERGVVSVEAFFASDLVKVKYCPQYLPLDRIFQVVNKLGYQASEYTGEAEAARAARRDLLLRIGVSGFLWMNIMTLSVALYVGYFEQIAESVRRFLPLVLMILATPVVFYSAQPILRIAYRGLLNRIIRMESLLGLGILAAYVYSAVQAFRGESHVYFDTASAIVTLVLVGKLIERSAKERTSRAITLLYRMMPKKARLLAGGSERFVSIDALQSGDTFVVKAGERIPADGVVVEGESHADESLLTGESVPVAKRTGCEVVSGSVNVGGVIHARATRVGSDATLSQMIKLVERAMSSRSRLERAVDRASRIFVPGVVFLALLTFVLWWATGAAGVGDALMRAITVLVIACPCALGMATPLAITAAVGCASRQGILVTDSSALETIRKVDVVILDKTGTVTEGDFSLLDFETVAEAPVSLGAFGVSTNPDMIDQRSRELFKTECLPLLASVERYSEHPLGRAVLKYAEQEGAEIDDASRVEVIKGQGIRGLVAGRDVFIGNRRLAESEAVVIDSSLESRAREWEREGYTVAFFGWARQLRGMLAFGDRVKSEAAHVVAQLKQRGIKVVIVSGDARATTEYVARQVSADDFVAEALPDEKTQIVKKFQASALIVAMVGDGINDGPALAQAELGIALGSGTDIAMKAAAMVLMTGSLGKVLDAFELSRKTRRVVQQNLFWAFLYNGVGIGLAMAGVLNPIMAASAMLLSSLSVIANSLRLSSGVATMPRQLSQAERPSLFQRL